MYDFVDWVWFNAANQFMDAEVGALVCPRPLYVEVGKRDDLFNVRHARPEAKKLASIYQRLKFPDRFHYEEHSVGEDRWITMGMDRTGILLLVVVHTFQQIDNEKYKIRIISTRKATRKETKQYREENI